MKRRNLGDRHQTLPIAYAAIRAIAAALLLVGCVHATALVLADTPPPVATPVVTPPDPVSPAKWGIAAAGQTDPLHFRDWATLLGKPQQWDVTWADKQDSWAKQVGMFNSWFLPRLALWKSDGRGFTISMPMVIPHESLAIGNSGADDANWTAIGQHLVAHGFGDAVIRLGWEFNGDWYPWRAKKAGVVDPNWRPLFRRIVGLLRAVPGQSFKFDWCPSLTGNKLTLAELAAIYPGSDDVDIIGLDVYNNIGKGEAWIPAAFRGSPQKHWDYWLTSNSGNHGLSLNWFVDFAAKQGKPMSLPEWGQNARQTGDEPYFITQMAAWIAAHNIYYQVYFSTKMSEFSLDYMPLSKAAFIAAFKK